MYNFLKRRQASFFWSGFLTFFNESYIILSFTAGINISVLGFASGSVAANTIFTVYSGVLLVTGPIIITVTLVKAIKNLGRKFEVNNGVDLKIPVKVDSEVSALPDSQPAKEETIEQQP